MQVNVTNIKSNLYMLDSLLNKYEDDLRNYYNELNFASNSWQDGNSLKFFDNVNNEKIKLNRTLEEFNYLKNVYKYILESYEKLGSKIIFDLTNKEQCLQVVDNYLSKLKDVINDYNNLDLSFCGGERHIIENEKQALTEEAAYVEQIKKDLKRVFDNIEEIEKNIKLKLSKINIEIIKETDLEGILG